MTGVPGFFTPRWVPPLLAEPGTPAALSLYDTEPLRHTLLKLVDFDLLNDVPIRFSAGAVNVRTGNFIYFDICDRRIGPEHVMASGALPPRSEEHTSELQSLMRRSSAVFCLKNKTKPTSNSQQS